MRLAAACALALWMSGCAGGPPRPATLDARNDACGACRMAVSNPRFAAQIVAPGEEPIFFDDLGCLADYLRQHPTQPAQAMIYVADHRTSEWADATAAVFTRVAGLDTPMASHLIAHASPSSRDADPAARGGIEVPPAALFPAMSQAGRR